MAAELQGRMVRILTIGIMKRKSIMGGFFGVVSTGSCVSDLFFGTDYHSHLGNQRGGMLVLGRKGFSRCIHDISNAQFRSKFQYDVDQLDGNMGIGSISDYGDQPLMTFSHLGTFGITMVGVISNLEALSRSAYRSNHAHFAEMTDDGINPTEMVASLISIEPTFAEGIRSAQQKIQGSCSMLMLSKEGIYAVRDRYGRTPVIIGEKTERITVKRTETIDGKIKEVEYEEEKHSYAATFETCAFQNLDYKVIRWLGPGEAVLLQPDGIVDILPPLETMRLCTFLFVYYGFPASCYEGINVEQVRYRCGAALARADGKVDVDAVAGVPDSGTAHALGYSQESHLPYIRSFVKYTPTWPRSFIPADQSTRNVVAKMKLISIPTFIQGHKLLFCEDSIVRGTQLRDTFARLPGLGAKEVHVRSACPPILYNCKYLNFSRSHTILELAARRAIKKLEGGDCEANLDQYADSTTEKYAQMVDEVRKELGLTSLRYQTLEDLIEAVGLPMDKLCTYCWNGREE